MATERVPDYAPVRPRRLGDDCPMCGTRRGIRVLWVGDHEYYCREHHPAGAEAFDAAVGGAWPPPSEPYQAPTIDDLAVLHKGGSWETVDRTYWSVTMWRAWYARWRWWKPWTW